MTNCDTDSFGEPLKYVFFVAKDAQLSKFARLTTSSADPTLSLDYGPKAYQGTTNVFAVKVRSSTGARPQCVCLKEIKVLS